MITDNHQWDFTSLSMVLPSTITQFIYAQPLPLLGTPSTLTDDRIWDHHASSCSVKFAYHYLVPKSNEATRRTPITWSWIWKLKIPHKIQLFVTIASLPNRSFPRMLPWETKCVLVATRLKHQFMFCVIATLHVTFGPHFQCTYLFLTFSN